MGRVKELGAINKLNIISNTGLYDASVSDHSISKGDTIMNTTKTTKISTKTSKKAVAVSAPEQTGIYAPDFKFVPPVNRTKFQTVGVPQFAFHKDTQGIEIGFENATQRRKVDAYWQAKSVMNLLEDLLLGKYAADGPYCHIDLTLLEAAALFGSATHVGAIRGEYAGTLVDVSGIENKRDEVWYNVAYSHGVFYANREMVYQRYVEGEKSFDGWDSPKAIRDFYAKHGVLTGLLSGFALHVRPTFFEKVDGKPTVSHAMAESFFMSYKTPIFESREAIVRHIFERKQTKRAGMVVRAVGKIEKLVAAGDKDTIKYTEDLTAKFAAETEHSIRLVKGSEVVTVDVAKIMGKTVRICAAPGRVLPQQFIVSEANVATLTTMMGRYGRTAAFLIVA